MTLEEFSNEFDTLIQSYTIPTQFGLESPIAFDEYEKSIFLTKAQESIIKELYNSFEDTEEIRRALESLVLTKTIQSSASDYTLSRGKIHTVFTLENNTWYIVYEEATSEDLCIPILDVVPVTHDDFSRVIRNPFKTANDRRILRLDKGNNEVELVSTKPITKYTIRYILKPEPIILVDLEDLSIEGKNTLNNCKLNSALHRLILNEAVRLALQSKGVYNNNQSK